MGLALDVPLEVGEVLRIVLHRLEVVLLLDHHQAGGVGHIAPLLEVDGEGVGVFQLGEARHVALYPRQGGAVDGERVGGKVVVQEEDHRPADGGVHVDVGFDRHLEALAQPVPQLDHGFDPVHPEGVRGAHGEHDGGYHVFEGEAGGQGTLEIGEIDVVVLAHLDADGLVLDVHPEQGEVGDVGVVAALGVDDAVILIVAEPLVLGLGQALANAEQVAVEVTEGPPLGEDAGGAGRVVTRQQGNLAHHLFFELLGHPGILGVDQVRVGQYAHLGAVDGGIRRHGDDVLDAGGVLPVFGQGAGEQQLRHGLPRGAHLRGHRHGLAEIGEAGAAIWPGVEARIRRQATGTKLVEGGKAGLAKHRPEIGIAGEEVGFDGGETGGELGVDGVDAVIFQIDKIAHDKTISTANVPRLYPRGGT
ncbi:hypothetical protein D3C72_1045980 [compost metagenome]